MTLFSPQDTWPLFALMAVGTAAAIGMEQRFRWGAKLSGPVLALLIAMVLSNTGIMPAEAPAYDFVSTWLVPLALPLLLFRADFRQIARATGRLMISFHVAAVGTLLGAVAAWAALKGVAPEPAKAAGIMAASYIGGMVNFLAVSESVRAPSSLTASLVVADNFVMAGVFILILWIAGSRFFLARYAHPHTAGADADASVAAAAHWQRKGISLLDVAVCLGVAGAVVAVAMLGKQWIEAAWPATVGAHWLEATVRTLATNRFVLVTAASLLAATLFSRPLARVNGADELGSYLLYLFLFSIGLPADLQAVAKDGLALFGFCGIIAVVNVAVTLLAGRLLRLPLEELMLGVNATLGGPPTAAAMAISKGWSRLVLPGLLAGLWGYCIGTPLGLLMTSLLEK
jgi:uncharacterized membrane protein